MVQKVSYIIKLQLFKRFPQKVVNEKVFHDEILQKPQT